MGADQMRRDGISRLHAWGKAFKSGCATYQIAKPRPLCGDPACPKRATYNTPDGPRCFTHARATNPEAQ